MPGEPVISQLEFYRIVRSQIEHEDGLIGQRTSWFITSQSFLFSAFAIVVNGLLGGLRAGDHVTRDLRGWLIVLIPLVGIVTAGLCEMTLLAGFAAMRRLRELYAQQAGDEAKQALPAIQGSLRIDAIGAAGPIALPVVFSVVWGLLLVKARGV